MSAYWTLCVDELLCIPRLKLVKDVCALVLGASPARTEALSDLEGGSWLGLVRLGCTLLVFLGRSPSLSAEGRTSDFSIECCIALL